MKISIWKYNPSVDAAPYLVSGEVPYKDKMTVLETLIYFNENVEFVAHDYNCHGRQCGRCSLMMDGVPVLACATPITDADHEFAPLKGFPVLRDLIVDKRDYDEELSRLYNRIRVDELEEEDLTKFEVEGDIKETAATLWNNTNCMRCGMCNASCPVFTAMPDKYVGPAFMLATYYRYLDPYDQSDRVMEAVSNGLYRCIQCGMCDTVCQRYEIDHASAWKALRKAAEERGLVPKYAK